MSFESIVNRNEFFSDHYLASVIAADLKGLSTRWKEEKKHNKQSVRDRVCNMSSGYFKARGPASEAFKNFLDTESTDSGSSKSKTRYRKPNRTQVAAAHAINDVVLEALGFTPHREQLKLPTSAEHQVEVPTAHCTNTPSGRLLVAIECGFTSEVDQLLASQLLEPVYRSVDKRRVWAAVDAVGEVFSAVDPPRYVLVSGGGALLLAERQKWAEGRYLALYLDGALERRDVKVKGELEMIASLFTSDALVPSDGRSVFEDLIERSHKHAVGVSSELRDGLRESVEILANEVIKQLDAKAKRQHKTLFSRSDIDAKDLTRQCLRYLYRLVVLLYAESRPELGIVPTSDDVYVSGYSLERLRELVVNDIPPDSLDGSHLHKSLEALFHLVNNGWHARESQQQLFVQTNPDQTLTADGIETSTELYVQMPGVEASLFDPSQTKWLNSSQVILRNCALHRVLKLLMLAQGKKRGRGRRRAASDSAGFISYAQLGINQLGAVYEGLMAYSGFFADKELYEVAKGGNPKDGVWVLPVDDADEYPDDVFVKTRDETTGQEHRILHPKNSFVYRLSGRDRQRSASYYTPEVLTQFVVGQTLDELFNGSLNHRATTGPPPGHHRATTGPPPGHHRATLSHTAASVLDLTICEPALGSGAFANETINQLAAEYLRRRQDELGESLDPEQYRLELQKVKAHFAFNQTYGVDLNATAVELAEVSLWLNCMYPGLKAPWFGLRLRRGNSLMGCRRATWRASELKDRPWAKTKVGNLQPPVDRPLPESLEDDEIHHFLLPGHGWAAVSNNKFAKQLMPERAKALRTWRSQMLKSPKPIDARRLCDLAAGIETLWHAATARLEEIQRATKRHLDLYGGPAELADPTMSPEAATRHLEDRDTPLGRLRTLMDAWVGLWLWPLDSASAEEKSHDTGGDLATLTGKIKPPTWSEWLQVAELLVQPHKSQGLLGQLELFSDVEALGNAEQAWQSDLDTVADLRKRFPWLDIAVSAAESEGAFHWQLEFAPAFNQGGFNIQVGNPPWVRLDWKDDLVLAEFDPWWGIANLKATPTRVRQHRRGAVLVDAPNLATYRSEVSLAAGTNELVSSDILFPSLSGVQTNLYMTFVDTTWRHLSSNGASAVGMLHPVGHFSDPRAGKFRSASYRHLRQHFHFVNQLQHFEDVGPMKEYSANVYSRSRDRLRFVQMSYLLHPQTAMESLTHDGRGAIPTVQYPSGGWDLRPHRRRKTLVDIQILADWSKLRDNRATPVTEAKLCRPVTTLELGALSRLAAHPIKIADGTVQFSTGWHERAAKKTGTIAWQTKLPKSWTEVILQGPHFTTATPFAKYPNENCRSKGDWSLWDLESLTEHVIPRTNYQRICDVANYINSTKRWGSRLSSSHWRLVCRNMTHPSVERTIHSCILHPGPSHIHSVVTLGFPTSYSLVVAAGIWSSLVVDALAKASGVKHVQKYVFEQMPMVEDSPLLVPLALRTLRLNSLTRPYSPLWEELYDPIWCDDRWTVAEFERIRIGDVEPHWSMKTPLRRDYERRLALVEIDALAALMLGLTAEQLCAMYRAWFGVLRKYEYRMAFDTEGRKICGHHQSAGFRQAELQKAAKRRELPPNWKNIWKLYERFEADPDSVDWEGQYTPPFTRVDREIEMTRAYNEFARRLKQGEYGSPSPESAR